MFVTSHVTQESHEDMQLLDSGCSNHMIGNRDQFARLDNSVKTNVKIGEENIVNVVGKETVKVLKVLTKKSQLKDVSDVYLVPGL